MRFDDFNRSERFFSATILPYFLLYDGMKGLHTFLQYVNKNVLSINEDAGESSRIDLNKFEASKKDIQIIPEVNLERDLPYYGIDIPPQSFTRRKNKQAVPDLLIIYRSWAILIEVKFFMSFSGHQLFNQMEEQSYYGDIIKNVSNNAITNFLQIGLVPLDIGSNHFSIILWQELLALMENVIPSHDYLLNKLKNAINRYEGK